jgi:hypothetical protein
VRKKLTILPAAMLLLVAACGGSDDPDAGDADTTAAAADTTVAVADTVATDDTVPADDADAGAGGDAADFFTPETCLDLAMAFSQAASMGMTGTGGSPEDSAQALQELADAAPSEIADDLDTLATAFGEFARTLTEAGVDFSDPASFSDPAVQQALTEASQSFDTDAINEASTRVSDYISAECEGG